jgi:hypothetical protein
MALGGAEGARLAARSRRLELTLTRAGERIATRRIRNLATGEAIDLPAELFAFEFAGGRRVAAGDFALRDARSTPSGFELLFALPGQMEARVAYEARPERDYVRKRLWLRRTGGPDARLLAVDLDNWRGVKRNWASMTADPMRCGSHPIYCDTWWAGVEFVAAFNRYDGDGFLLRSRPGGVRIGGEWTELRSTVVGPAPTGQARRAFLEYLEDVRLAPARWIACYNAWWTLPKVITRVDTLALIAEMKAKFKDRHGEFFDIVTADMGWSNPKSIWQIDRSILPDAFDPIRRALEPAGARLGLWMSPSEQYPPVCDYDWAERQGYTVLRDPEVGGRVRPALSLADPRYRNETKTALAHLISEHGAAHIKYDGFQAKEHKPHHDLLPGDDSVEPLAAYAFELLQASKAANPNVVTEPTFLNSHYCYISPWILKYSDTLWGNTSDCALGIGPAPEYRDSHTNAREYLIFSSLNEVWVPQNAVQYFDIVQVDAKGGFANHAAMAVGRGRFFLPCYINPKVMEDDDWRVLAGLMRWARRNQELLRHTEVVTSRVEAGEPYIYAHWLGQRGVLVVRNPSNESVDYALNLSRTGAPMTLRDGVACTQYPCRRGLATGLTAASTVKLRLAPWEVQFVEVAPRSELREVVVVGGRWYRDGERSTAVAPDPGVSQVRALLPGGGERVAKVTATEASKPAARIVSRAVRPLPRSEWLTQTQQPRPAFLFRYPAEPDSPEVAKLREEAWRAAPKQSVPSCEFELECSVSIPPDAARGQALLLVEFPGRVYRPNSCSATIDGRSAELRGSDSTDHVGFFAATPTNAWKDMAQHESQWRWYICEVAPGRSTIRYKGRAGLAEPRFRLWAWAEREAQDRVTLPLACSEPAMPQHRDRITCEGVRAEG